MDENKTPDEQRKNTDNSRGADTDTAKEYDDDVDYDNNNNDDGHESSIHLTMTSDQPYTVRKDTCKIGGKKRKKLSKDFVFYLFI